MEKNNSIHFIQWMRKSKKYLIVLILSIAVIFAALPWFILTLRSNVYDTQLTNMNELAEHDITTIHNFLSDEWRTMQNTASKAVLRRMGTDQEIEEFLREEQVLSDFEDIYLIDDEYNAYDTTGKTAADPEIIEDVYLQREQVMTSVNPIDGEISLDDSYLFGGVKLSGVNVGGHKMIEIIGKMDLNKIQDRIRISNYSGQGYSSVFDQNGKMIIGINAAGQHLVNYYDFLENSTNLGKEGVDRTRELIAAGDPFIETFVDKYTGQTYMASFQSIDELDWGFIMSVPKAVFDQQNRKMLRMVMIMIIAIFAALLLMILFVFRSQVVVARQKEKEKQRQALEDALEQAKIANKAKTTFLFNMSHDIRTPMNAVLGLSTLAKKHMDEPEKLKYYMDQIEIAGKQLLSIINNILELSRIESDKVRIDEEVTDTTDVYESLQTVFRNQNRASKLNLNFKNQIRNRYMYMDRTHVEEVLTNLVSNAMKYTEDGGNIDVILSENPGADEEHTILQAVVRDNGIGMSDEYQEKLFEQFERERNSTVSKIQGTGLGLSIVKKLVDMMHGSIEVDSKQGIGTCMKVDIPLRIAEAPVSQTAAVTEEEISFEGKRILMAEDIDINAMIATEILQASGFIVDRAENGQVCVEMLQKASSGFYDLILMDIQMPVMDGFQATKEIRTLRDEKKAKLPIIAMTANAFQEDRMNALRAGMNAHIAKPIEISTLLATLKNVLKAKRYEIDSQDMEAFRRQYEKLGCTCGYLIYDADEEEKITFADEVTASMFGCSSVEEFLEYTGGTFKGMVHPDDYENLESAIKYQLSHAGKDVDIVDYHITRKDGEVRKFKDIGYRAFNGEKNQFYVYVADVTDVEDLYNDNRIDIEELLSENGMDIREIAKNDQGIYCADATRRIIYWNKAAEKITGYKKAEIMGMNCFHTAMKHKDASGTYLCTGLCPMMRSILDGESVSKELSVLCSDGHRKTLTVRTEPLYKDGKVYGAIEYFVEV